jgi:hypothetical protein
MKQNHSVAMTTDEVDALLDTYTQWNGVSSSIFEFLPGMARSICPSLAKECPGPQYLDFSNDVAFIPIGGCCTLAATWYVTSDTNPEADIVINSRVNWDSIDLATVLLHENGHALGLGHSDAPDSVMAATYTVANLTLSEDDIRGITYLYPASAESLGIVSGTVSDSSGVPIAGAKVTIDYFPGPAATTDTDGMFSIPGVPILGTYSVTASAKSYRSQSQDGSPNGEPLAFELPRGNGGGGNKDIRCPKAGPNAC